MVLKRMGDLVAGDIVVGRDGQPVVITEAFEEHIPETMYELELEDGPGETTVVRVSGNHLWYVESSLDLQYHAQRRREGRRALAHLSQGQLDQLLEIANLDPDGDEVDTALIDMVTLCGVEDSRPGIHALERIAESLGPVVENNTSMVDFLTGESVEDPTRVRGYDARQFAQQILSLHGDRSHRRRWPLVAGRVMDTEHMVAIADTVTIPTATPRG